MTFQKASFVRKGVTLSIMTYKCDDLVIVIAWHVQGLAMHPYEQTC